MKTDHLALAREDLAIAESSGDLRREAYKRAAEHIAAHKTAAGATNRDIAMSVGRHENYVKRLLKWRETGYAAPTPFLMDERATERAARSHAKGVLRDPDQRRTLLGSLEPSELDAVARDATDALAGRARAQHREHSTEPTIGDMEAEHGPLPALPASRLIALSRIAAEIEDLADRIEREGVASDVATLRQAQRNCELIADAALGMNAVIAQAIDAVGAER